jgi:transcriptional regulator with XRE-family HTH domain
MEKTADWSELGAFIKKFREERGLTQTRLDEELHLNPKLLYTGKVERGDIKSPNDAFLEALSSYTGTSVEKLREMSRTPVASMRQGRIDTVSDGGRKSPLKLLFTHSLWSAPVVLAAARNLAPEFQMASRRDGESGEASWLGVSGLEESTRAGRKADTPFAVSDILRDLSRGSVDVAIVPGSTVASYRGFQRIATLVDSAAGCYLVMTEKDIREYRKNLSIDRNINTKELGQLIMTAVAAGVKPLFCIEENTMAQRCLEAAAEAAAKAAREEEVRGGSRPKQRQEIPPSTAMRLHVPGNELTGMSFESLKSRIPGDKTDQQLLGVITWAPHCYLLRRAQIESGNEEVRVLPIRLMPTPEGRPRHLTYEIITRELAPVTADFRSALVNLVRQIWYCCDSIRDVSLDNYSSESVATLGDYFGLSTEDTIQGLQSILFSVKYDVEFVRGVQ